jgi:predicted DNA-binding transcriptional regulator AlpA
MEIMAYDKQKIFEQAKAEIVKNKLIFMDEVPDFLPCSRSTFYEYYPNDSDELDTLKSLISINKTQIKTSLRSKWYKSNAPALQMALMKLIATPEELKKLSMQYIESENTNKNFDINTLYDKEAPEELE